MPPILPMDRRPPESPGFPEPEEELAAAPSMPADPPIRAAERVEPAPPAEPFAGPGVDRLPAQVDLTDLVRRARQGEPIAQEGIVRAFEGRVLRLARHMMGNRADAEDAAQEAFLRLFRHLERLDPLRDPTGWVVRVTVHVCWDHLSRRSRQSEDPLQGEAWISSAPAPSAVAAQAQQREILRRSLQVLAPRERAVFVLHEVDGEEVPAIARALRISRITVRRHLSRARARLRRLLQERYPQLI